MLKWEIIEQHGGVELEGLPDVNLSDCTSVAVMERIWMRIQGCRNELVGGWS